MNYHTIITAVFLTLILMGEARSDESSLNDRLTKIEQRIQNIEQLLMELKGSRISTETEVTPLPDSFGQQEIGELFSEFKQNWNAQDMQRMYNMFSRWAQLYFDKSEMENMFKPLYQTHGDIEDGVYSHFTFKNKDESGAFWNIYYNVRQKHGAITRLRVTIREYGGSTEIVSFNYASG